MPAIGPKIKAILPVTDSDPPRPDGRDENWVKLQTYGYDIIRRVDMPPYNLLVQAKDGSGRYLIDLH